MKKLSLALLASASMLSASWAGSLGPGPWANGAYFPNQYDGRYSAFVYNNTQGKGQYDAQNFPSTTIQTNNINPGDGKAMPGNMGGTVSGVIGFGLKDGSPSVRIPNASEQNNNTRERDYNVANSIRLDTSHNYFVIFVDGDVFAGQTIAGVNGEAESVHGTLWQGVGQNTFKVMEATVIGQSFEPFVLPIPGATANGYFNAKIKSKKAVFTFAGSGAMTVRQADTNVTKDIFTYPFNLNGIKVSFNTESGYKPEAAATGAQ